MIAATNQIGFVVQRFDGPDIGWFAITEPVTRDEAKQQLANLVRTPGAEYRVYAALETRS
ncbi:hypothetical protein [Massilia sp. CCM 8734]|uniref:hypothetical protein n=1 Tax=Massilia sp. CCM 8734 TaxID=2609283 RepID=UPI00142442F0|nr:hypothetical protein [Massilia sp. CCM 8734]NHZ94589.1 hypothetical protein [Massilia sp. CCM 8734]